MVEEDPSVLRANSSSELGDRLQAERSGAPFVLYRNGEGVQHIQPLDDATRRLTVGRGTENDVVLDWDSSVSRIHAELEQVAGCWTIVDDGLSRNGTFVNGERLRGRARLQDGDVVRVGTTSVAFFAPLDRASRSTIAGDDLPTVTRLSDGQTRVLLALCRPYKHGNRYATPATNRQIADELFLSVDAVKTHLRVLFQKFNVEELPQNQKRTRLVEQAFEFGLVSERDL